MGRPRLRQEHVKSISLEVSGCDTARTVLGQSRYFSQLIRGYSAAIAVQRLLRLGPWR
jgi:hypothetical protein